MKLIKQLIMTSAAALLAMSTQAQLTTFEPATTASASEVNGNFTYLLGLIEGLQADVTVLQQAAPTNSVAGRTYRLAVNYAFIEDQSTATSNPQDNYLWVIGGAQAIFTFGETTVSIDSGIERERGIGLAKDGSSIFHAGSSAESLTGISAEYMQEGRVVSVPDLGVTFIASTSGEVLLFGGMVLGTQEDNGATFFEQTQGIAIEIIPASGL